MFVGLSVDCFLLVCIFVFGVFACGEVFFGWGCQLSFYTTLLLYFFIVE